MRIGVVALFLCLAGALPAAAAAQTTPAAPAAVVPAAAPFHLTRASGPIRIDGDLSDEAWKTATRIDRWYEIQPGDNVAPSVKTVGYLTYDDRALYVGMLLEDPHPGRIRAPLGDHDAMDGSNTDFGGVVIDTLNTGRSATEFFVSPGDVQFDAIIDDATGENAAPDFFWQSATRLTAQGWSLEMRIPFSTLRYQRVDPQHWSIILLRNYPRAFHYQIASMPVPRGSNCFVCHATALTGLDGLPSGGHLVAAPYVSARESATPPGGEPGPALRSDPPQGRAGLDVKYTPNANTAVDATLKPDFSQIESDTAQISANERFALFFPEKRPFFLEGVDLFQTPIQAVYTRTITDPTWGARVTGKDGDMRYTVITAADAGGGSVVLPGSNGSSTAPQDFSSTVFLGRVKEQFGHSFFGALATDREIDDSPAHNRVAGPDFEWRPSKSDVFTGQWLLSETETPTRPDLADEWTGQTERGSALQTFYTRNTRHYDAYSRFTDITDGFRADTGFVPQVGYQEGYFSTGWSVHPKGPIARERTFVNVQYQRDAVGVITQNVQPGFGMDTRWNGFVQVRYTHDETRAGTTLIGRQQFGFTVQFAPSRLFALLYIDSTMGQDIDFDNAQPATGYTLNLHATLQPTRHLLVDAIGSTRSLNVAPNGASELLFTQQVSRAKATYTFTSRLFVRLIGQYVATRSNPLAYPSGVAPRAGDFSGSALFAYKLNWQSVMFVGYGDDRELTDPGLTGRAQQLRPLDRQFFVKLSYALQR